MVSIENGKKGDSMLFAAVVVLLTFLSNHHGHVAGFLAKEIEQPKQMEGAQQLQPISYIINAEQIEKLQDLQEIPIFYDVLDESGRIVGGGIREMSVQKSSILETIQTSKASSRSLPVYNCVTIENNGDPTQKLDVVFVGNSWPTTQRLVMDAENITSFLQNLEPYKSQRSDINFYVATPSVQGMGVACGSTGKPFYSNMAIAPASSCPEHDIILILDYYTLGGSAGWAILPFFPNVMACNSYKPGPGGTPWKNDLVTHEFGHTFFVGDEYSVGWTNNFGFPSNLPNCDYMASCPLTSSVGSQCSQGCEYHGNSDRYRDHPNDVMYQLIGQVGGYGPVDEKVIKAGIDYYAQKLENITIVYSGNISYQKPYVNNSAFTPLIKNDYLFTQTFGGAGVHLRSVGMPVGVDITGVDAAKNSQEMIEATFYDRSTGESLYIKQLNSCMYPGATIPCSNPAVLATSLAPFPGKDASGWESSIVLDQNELPHVLFYNGNNILYSWFDGSVWNTESIIAPGAQWLDLDIDNNNIPFIVFGDGTGLYLGSRISSGNWIIQQIGLGGYYVEMEIDSKNRAHIVYVDQSFALRYARIDQISGQFNNVIEQNGKSAYISLALDPQGNPYVSYAYSSGSLLGVKYAKFDGQVWNKQWVEKNSDWPTSVTFSHTSIEVDAHGNVIMTYPLYDGQSWVDIVYYDVTHGYKVVPNAFTTGGQPIIEVVTIA